MRDDEREKIPSKVGGSEREKINSQEFRRTPKYWIANGIIVTLRNVILKRHPYDKKKRKWVDTYLTLIVSDNKDDKAALKLIMDDKVNNDTYFGSDYYEDRIHKMLAQETVIYVALLSDLSDDIIGEMLEVNINSNGPLSNILQKIFNNEAYKLKQKIQIFTIIASIQGYENKIIFANKLQNIFKSFESQPQYHHFLAEILSKQPLDFAEDLLITRLTTLLKDTEFLKTPENAEKIFQRIATAPDPVETDEATKKAADQLTYDTFKDKIADLFPKGQQNPPQSNKLKESKEKLKNDIKVTCDAISNSDLDANEKIDLLHILFIAAKGSTLLKTERGGFYGFFSKEGKTRSYQDALKIIKDTVKDIPSEASQDSFNKKKEILAEQRGRMSNPFGTASSKEEDKPTPTLRR